MHIVVAVDGSEQSDAAVRVLAHFAPTHHVTLVHATDGPAPAYPTMFPERSEATARAVAQAMGERGTQVLNRARSVLSPRAGPVTERLEHGKPVEMILSVAAETDTDLLVLGSRGLGVMRELVVGSVSHRSIVHAWCPTLVIREPVPALHRIILAVEEAADAEAAIVFLSKQPFTHSCEITVLTVMPFTHPVYPVGAMISESVRKDMESEAQQFIDGIASTLTNAGHTASGVIGSGAPAMEILKEAATRRADLIMMGRRRKGIDRFMLGSVSHGVLHHARSAVLILH